MAAGNLLKVSPDSPPYSRVSISVNDVSLSIATLQHYIPGKPYFVFLHGFGCTKEDFADFLNIQALASNYSFLAYDAPGHGETECQCEHCCQTASSDAHPACHMLDNLSIPFLSRVAEAVLGNFGISEFDLSGHSMGGLTGLYLAHEYPARVHSFTNIKGNLGPEDCFLSRQVFNYPADDPELFFEDFVARAARSKSLGSALYASSLKHKVRSPRGVATSQVFRSMVKLSDTEDLMRWFLGLQANGTRLMFMFGEENRGLSYLPGLKADGVKLAEVVQSGHFVMYSNPILMWKFIEEFLKGPKE